MPRDEVRGWWRYHHLFADLLHARCGKNNPANCPGCTARRPGGTKLTG